MAHSVRPDNRTVGILLNPLSGRIKQKVSAFRELCGSIAGRIYREACTQDAFKIVLDEFAERQVDLLVIIAGDGTVHAVLSHIFGAQGKAFVPLMSIIPAGTTNMTAKDFNISGKPEKVLKRLLSLLAVSGPYPSVTRPVLRIKNGDNAVQYGMFFGAGIIAEGVDYFHKRVRGLGITGERASGIVLLRYLFSLLTGRKRSDSGKTEIHIQYDDEISTDEHCLLIFATSLDRLLLGMRPYWGGQQQAVHVTLIKPSPRRLWWSIWPLLCGKGSVLSEQDGYNSCNVASLNILISDNFIIDGEIYRADREKGAIHITANDTINIIDINTWNYVHDKR